MRFIVFAALFLAAFVSASAFAEENRSPSAVDTVFARGCGDDRGVDRCDSAVQQRMRDLYAVAATDVLLGQGVTLRRAMFVDGYGNDVVAISFVRRPGQSPTVEVHVPQNGTVAGRPLAAQLSNDMWQAVLAQSRFFDRALAPETNNGEQNEDSMTFCLHGWFVVVEAVDSPRVNQNTLAGTGSVAEERDPSLPVDAPMDPGRIRSDAESSCADGLASDFAFAMAEIAHQALPECGSLVRATYRNIPELLRQCRLLAGDRLVAGEAAELAEKLERAIRAGDEQEQAWLFVGIGPQRSARLRSAITGGRLWFARFTGIDADHAEISGLIYFDNAGDGAGEVMDVTFRLIRQTGKLVIDTFEVSNRRPIGTGS